MAANDAFVLDYEPRRSSRSRFWLRAVLIAICTSVGGIAGGVFSPTHFRTSSIIGLSAINGPDEWGREQDRITKTMSGTQFAISALAPIRANRAVSTLRNASARQFARNLKIRPWSGTNSVEVTYDACDLQEALDACNGAASYFVEQDNTGNRPAGLGSPAVLAKVERTVTLWRIVGGAVGTAVALMFWLTARLATQRLRTKVAT